MKNKEFKDVDDFGRFLGLSEEQIKIADLKSKLKKRIILESRKQKLSNANLAKLSGLTRTVVSGIVNGSLQSVSIERLIRLALALRLTVDFSIKKAA
jgi:predicted XRE-type DNA-binding protein